MMKCFRSNIGVFFTQPMNMIFYFIRQIWIYDIADDRKALGIKFVFNI
jgi:hypothetical protein